ncbi:MAG: PD40 domain-containing protein [Anaerolineales bacterium]|nr:PD40 domain-containing protein [Anaerolineales bacterium]
MKERILVASMLLAAVLTACEMPLAATPEERAANQIVRAAYQKSDGPYIWTEGGEPQKLADSVNTTDICISGDGSAVAYRKNGEIYAIRVEGGEPVPLLGRAYLDTLSPESGGFITINQFDFSADSRYLYFNTKVPDGQQYDLYRVDLDGSTPERIFAPGEGGNFSFSPDGEWMTVFHTGEIVLVRQDGKDPNAAFAFPENAPVGSNGPQIVWAQDSSGFSVVSYGAKTPGPQPMTVWFVPVQGEPEKRWAFQGYPGAILSPDGSRAVYFDRHDGTTDVHIADAAGLDTLYASLGKSADLMEWAPDSRRFLLNYYQYREDSPAMINVPYVCAPGEALVRLTDTPTAYPAHWVDARRVLFSGEDGRLFLQELANPSVLVDEGLSINAFDFTLLPAE